MINEEYKYYDQGWNDYLNGISYNPKATKDWRDGWQDCHEAKFEDQKEIK